MRSSSPHKLRTVPEEQHLSVSAGQVADLADKPGFGSAIGQQGSSDANKAAKRPAFQPVHEKGSSHSSDRSSSSTTTTTTTEDSATASSSASSSSSAFSPHLTSGRTSSASSAASAPFAASTAGHNELKGVSSATPCQSAPSSKGQEQGPSSNVTFALPFGPSTPSRDLDSSNVESSYISGAHSEFYFNPSAGSDPATFAVFPLRQASRDQPRASYGSQPTSQTDTQAKDAAASTSAMLAAPMYHSSYQATSGREPILARSTPVESSTRKPVQLNYSADTANNFAEQMRQYQAAVMATQFQHEHHQNQVQHVPKHPVSELYSGPPPFAPGPTSQRTTDLTSLDGGERGTGSSQSGPLDRSEQVQPEACRAMGFDFETDFSANNDVYQTLADAVEASGMGADASSQDLWNIYASYPSAQNAVPSGSVGTDVARHDSRDYNPISSYSQYPPSSSYSVHQAASSDPYFYRSQVRFSPSLWDQSDLARVMKDTSHSHEAVQLERQQQPAAINQQHRQQSQADGSSSSFDGFQYPSRSGNTGYKGSATSFSTSAPAGGPSYQISGGIHSRRYSDLSAGRPAAQLHPSARGSDAGRPRSATALAAESGGDGMRAANDAIMGQVFTAEPLQQQAGGDAYQISGMPSNASRGLTRQTSRSSISEAESNASSSRDSRSAKRDRDAAYGVKHSAPPMQHQQARMDSFNSSAGLRTNPTPLKVPPGANLQGAEMNGISMTSNSMTSVTDGQQTFYSALPNFSHLQLDPNVDPAAYNQAIPHQGGNADFLGYAPRPDMLNNARSSSGDSSESHGGLDGGRDDLGSGDGKRLYECRTCGRKFPRPSALVVHERIHSGEKPFICEHCGRPFTVASNLRRHQKIHVKQTRMAAEEGRVAPSASSGSTIKARPAVRHKSSRSIGRLDGADESHVMLDSSFLSALPDGDADDEEMSENNVNPSQADAGSESSRGSSSQHYSSRSGSIDDSDMSEQQDGGDLPRYFPVNTGAISSWSQAIVGGRAD